MKYFFLIGCVFLMSTALCAPPGEGGNTCEVWEKIVNDNTCNSGGCVTSASFEIPDCPTLYLSCQFVGTNCDATHLKVTVILCRYGQEVDHEQNWTQDPGSCGGAGPDYHGITVEPGQGYTLEVCFEACPNYSCPSTSDCTARGRVSVRQP
jgi:hypothetical protein